MRTSAALGIVLCQGGKLRIRDLPLMARRLWWCRLALCGAVAHAWSARSAPLLSPRGAARARAARGGAGFAAETAAARPSPPADEFDAFVPGETQTVAVRDVVVGAGGDAEGACALDDLVTIEFEGRVLATGKVFLPRYTRTVRLGAGKLVPGWEAGILKDPPMRAGGERLIRVPNALGFGGTGAYDTLWDMQANRLSDDDSRRAVPKYADLEFECKLLKVERGLLADLVDLLGFGFNVRTFFLLVSAAIVVYADVVAPSGSAPGGGPAP